jgi:hypothetical protein
VQHVRLEEQSPSRFYRALFAFVRLIEPYYIKITFVIMQPTDFVQYLRVRQRESAHNAAEAMQAMALPVPGDEQTVGYMVSRAVVA